jgi:hypothetical protein
VTLPYKWYPQGTSTEYAPYLTPGLLVAHEHAIWRIVEVRRLPDNEWTEQEREAVENISDVFTPHTVVLRPASITLDDPRSRDLDKHYRSRGAMWHVYRDEHYPICGTCHEPLPCREKKAAQIAAAAGRELERYTTPGVCPACQEPITARQKTLTFETNVKIPGGPPVVFHARGGECRRWAIGYEDDLLRHDPTYRTTLSCPGSITNHLDGTYECTEGPACRGPQVPHPCYACCGCCRWTPENATCHPDADSRLRGEKAA